MSSPSTCRVCGHSGPNRRFTAREMMFGTREPFDYFECGDCGCVQIETIPADLGKHYPPEYYSFHPPSGLRAWLKGPWLCDPFPATAVLQRALGLLPGVRLMPAWMARPNLSRNAAILEVGSGGGMRLLAMKAAGFGDLTGVDPFLDGDRVLPGGIRLLKREIAAVDRAFDFVMLHHAYEHMPEPKATLEQLRVLLKEEGTLLIRIPVASSWAWRHYGVDWLGLDPPRHLYLHTLQSFRLVAERAGFRIADYFFDSDDSQFWGSEQYRKGIAHMSERSYARSKRGSAFSRAEIRRFRREAARLNKGGEGDSAAFYLKRS